MIQSQAARDFTHLPSFLNIIDIVVIDTVFHFGHRADLATATFKKNSILTVHNFVYTQTLALLQKVYNNVAPIMIQNLFEINKQQSKPTQYCMVKEVTFFIVPTTKKTMLDATISLRVPTATKILR